MSHFGIHAGAHSGFHRAQQNRAEDQRKGLSDYTTEDKKVMHFATWETKTQNRLDQNRVEREFQDLLVQEKEVLAGRRQRLAALLKADEEREVDELLKLKPSIEDRRNFMLNKAKALRDKHRAEEEADIENKLEEKFLAGTDEIREYGSRAMAYHIAAARQAQIRDKEEKAKRDKQSEQIYLKFMKRYDDKILAREQKEEEDKRILKIKVNKELDENVNDMLSQKEKLRQLEIQENARLNKMFDDIQVAKVEEAKQTLAEGKARVDAMKRFNAYNMRLKSKEAEAVRQLDHDFVQKTIEAERQAKEEEEAARIAKKEDAKNFQKYLQSQMIKEAASEAEVDQLIEEYVAMKDAERQARWDAEKAARDKLAAECEEERINQINARLRERMEDKERGVRLRHEIEADVQAHLAEEKAKADQRMEVQHELMEDIQAQRNEADERRAAYKQSMVDEGLRMQRERELLNIKIQAAIEKEEAAVEAKRREFQHTSKNLGFA